MTEFQELVKDAPKFVSMERGELVAYAYAMYATGQKMEADNAKLRELVEDMLSCIEIRAAFGRPPTEDMYEQFAKRASGLGVEVDE